MAGVKCSIDGCKRNSDNVCAHCQGLVCTKHYIEHIKLVNSELPALSDELNVIMNTMQEHDFTSYAFQQIEQWRQATHQRIDKLCDEKKEQLKLEIKQKIDNQKQHLRHLITEINELINDGDASFKAIENIKKNIEECRQQCKQLETTGHFRLDMKAINFETIFFDHELFRGAGTLLSLEHQRKLNEFYGREEQTWMLIYKASRDGFASTDFHRCCNNQGPTMTVIQTKEGGFLFGGYTSVPWNSIQTYAVDNNGPFLFTLINPHGILPTKYPIRLRNHSIFDHNNYGPTFGAGHDLVVSNLSNTNNHSSLNFPHSYNDTTKRGTTTFTGERTFQTNDIEVYRLVQN